MIKVKFRGEMANGSGQFVYGDLHHNKHTVGIYTPDYGGAFVQVYPDTIKQLVGYDIKDKEVYEGDTVIDQFGGEGKIELHAVVVDFNGEYPQDLTYRDDLILTLDEDDDENGDEGDDND